MTYQHLLVENEGPLARVTLNRPERLNALNPLLVRELREYFEGLYRDTTTRVVILGGSGRGFCAGLDLKEHHETGRTRQGVTEGLAVQRSIRDIMLAMRRCPQPIVCVAQGAASGGGFGLALASDIRLVTPDVKMNAAFIRIGLTACDMGVSYFLPRMIGTSAAAEFMLTGRFIDAARAQSLGLVSRVGELAALHEEAQALARDMLNATPLGLRLTKEALGLAIDAGSLEAVIAMEDRNQILCTQSEDFDEGVAAFLEKRPPRYGA